MFAVPTLICVDVEPDTRRPDINSSADWKGFEECWQLFEELRCRANIEAYFCWFLRMDPQVELLHGSAHWAFERYGALIERLRSAGDEVGLHTHAWRPVGGEWVADYADQGWVNQCVRVSFHAYENAFGRTCRAFRFGDHWMNEETFNLVESLGAHYNLTLEPGVGPSAGGVPGEASTGRFPDYAKVPRDPYKPAREDFRTRGDAHTERDLWVIPVSTARLPPWRAAPFYRRVIWRARYGPRRFYPLSLELEPDQFKHSVNNLIQLGNARHLCVVVRTDAVLKRTGAAHVRENLELLLSQGTSGRLKLTTPSHLVAGRAHSPR